MNDGLLSQEEIDALLNGGFAPKETLSETDKDLLGEIGNISMGSASTALSTIINRMVNITTPRVSITSLREMKKEFDVPIISVEVEYIEGLIGANLLLIKITDAIVIADLMMGGDGTRKAEALSEIEISAVSEAMNQMIGSSATSLSQMLNMPINISPPIASVWDEKNNKLSEKISEDDEIVKISFRLTIDALVDSEIMLLLPIKTAKMIINKLTGSDENVTEEPQLDFDNKKNGEEYFVDTDININQVNFTPQENNKPQYNVQRAEFAPLTPIATNEVKNIDLILDVPLEISVVLGRTKKTIKEILELSVGSLVELEKLTEEPVEILVNGKKVALGEVVVIDENFGVRITSIVSNAERVKSLQGK
ncbi:MAG: flagellar motor switch phosphatase FliY [Caloramator sp.]|nr:flagellar motor switch phosphatase FliY [Caloramator sp.]